MRNSQRVARHGFTLLELVVAIMLSGVVLLGARALWESLAVSIDRLHVQVRVDASAANGERLLRSLVGRLEVGTTGAREFGGDEHQVRFTTWCDVPAGWQERCDVVLGIEPDSNGRLLQLVARLSTGERVTLRRGLTSGAIAYLNDPIGGGSWFGTWEHGIVAPLAIGVIANNDTVIVRIGERE